MQSWLFYKYWPLSTNILIFKQQVFHSPLHRFFQSTKPTSNKTIPTYSAFTSYCFFLNKVQNWVISPGRCGHRSQNGRNSCDRRALPLLSNSTTEDVKKVFCHRVYLRQVSVKTISSYQSFTTITNIYRRSDHDTIIRIDYTIPQFPAPPMAGPSHESSIATKYRRICHQNWPGLNFWSDGENSVQEN